MSRHSVYSRGRMTLYLISVIVNVVAFAAFLVGLFLDNSDVIVHAAVIYFLWTMVASGIKYLMIKSKMKTKDKAAVDDEVIDDEADNTK